MLFIKLALLVGLLVGVPADMHDHAAFKDFMKAVEDKVKARDAIHEKMDETIIQYCSSLSQKDLAQFHMRVPAITSGYIREHLQGTPDEFIEALPKLALAVARDFFKEVLQDFDQVDVDSYLHSRLNEAMRPLIDTLNDSMAPLKPHLTNVINESVNAVKDYASGKSAETPDQVMSRLKVIQDTFQDHLAGALATFVDHFSNDIREAGISDSFMKSFLIQLRTSSFDNAMASLRDIVDNITNLKRLETAIHDSL